MLADDLRQDMHHALRSFRRTPLFAATAVISVALGVGANTLVFSIRQCARPETAAGQGSGHRDVRAARRLVRLALIPPYRDLRDRNVTFEGLAGYRITMMEVDASQTATHEWGYLANRPLLRPARLRPGRRPILSCFRRHGPRREPVRGPQL